MSLQVAMTYLGDGKKHWPDLRGLRPVWCHRLAPLSRVRNIDPIWGDCDRTCSGCLYSDTPEVRNIDPIWGDCDTFLGYLPSYAHLQNHVRNIDPIWGDCDPLPQHHCRGEDTQGKKHWPDLRGLRRCFLITQDVRWARKSKKHWPDLRGLRPANSALPCLASALLCVRNIDPIWGDCDQGYFNSPAFFKASIW